MQIRNLPVIITLFLIITFYGLRFGSKIGQVASGESTCVCAYDGFGYYMYLPQLFENGDLRINAEWAANLQNTYCDRIETYQLYRMDNGNLVDIYHMGLAFLQLPAYLTAEVVAWAGGFPRDGFSQPYHIAYLLNAYLFVLLGAFFLLKLLRLFFREPTAALLLFVAFFGTNYFSTATEMYQLQHHYLFAIIAAMAYHLLKAVRSELFSDRNFYYAVALFGLITAIRPTHAILGLLPFILLWKRLPKKQFWTRILLFPLSAFIWNLPQLFYWKLVGGSWLLLNLHTEEIILTDPNLWSFLFSFRKGWLLYTPVFLLLIPAFYMQLRRQRQLARALLVTLVASIWVLSSWECWWYASSFGQRVMVDYYPLLFLPLGFLLESVRDKIIAKSIVSAFIGLACALNAIQSTQFATGILHHSRMSREQYAYIFGRLSISGYDESRLLIDRNDTAWANRAVQHGQHFRKQLLFVTGKQLDAEAGKDLGIARIPFYGPMKTDEAMIDAELEVTVEDSTKSSLLRLEMVSRYNAYQWESHELAAGSPAGRKRRLCFRFTMAEIRHSDDLLQVYIDNDSGGRVVIHSMKLTAISLVRN